MSLVRGNGCPETFQERILSLYLLGAISQRYVRLIHKTVKYFGRYTLHYLTGEDPKIYQVQGLVWEFPTPSAEKC